MLEKKEMYIRELLENDQDFQELEGQICDLIPVKLDKKGLDDENIQKFNELQLKIIEQAYLKGYSDGVKLYDQIQEEPEKHLTISQLDKINREMEELKKPATKKAAGLK